MFPRSVKLPNIYLLHGQLSTEEMNQLYNHPKIKSMISLTHGEGFGRPLLEASMAGLPVAASNWSGQVDFLTQEHSVLIGGEMSRVPQSAVWENIVIPESSWFIANEEESSKALLYSYYNHEQLKEKANRLSEINRNNFSHDAMTKKLGKILDTYMKDISKPVELKLPKLKPVIKKEELVTNG